MSDVATLSQGVGYGVVIGIGLFFAGLMTLITYIQARYTDFKPSQSEEFTSASRSVKSGLVASGIVSAWTWAATLLTSSAQAYNYGISGPWWYAAGACVQIFLFAQNAAKLKLHAPNAHTHLEVIYARWGKFAHLTMLYFSCTTNILVSSMLVLGASATVTDLTGMNTIASLFLIPFSVMIYVLAGGLRATFLADYVHNCLLYPIIFAFAFTIYATSDKIGSPQRMWELLQEAAAKTPVPGNAEGSYTTMRSRSGIMFAVINLVGNFSAVFLDCAYWMRGIASQPQHAVKAFIMGGLSWFPVPMCMATAMGLCAIALRDDPDYPTYPDYLSSADVLAGLPAPTAASAILGKSGAAAMLVLLFMAVTSASSAELIATSSVFTYDVYLTYINPNATEKQVSRVSRLAVCGWALCMSLLGLIFYYIGISMGWLYFFMGVANSAAVVPVALGIMYYKANKWACITGAIGGLACGLTAWLVTAGVYFGELTVDTTGEDYAMLAGNLTSIGVGAIISLTGSFIWPENETWESTHAIKSFAQRQEESEGASASPDLPMSDKTGEETPSVKSNEGASASHNNNVQSPEEIAALHKSFKQSVIMSVTLTLVLLIIIPLPLFFTQHQFSATDFTAWVSVTIAWLFFASFATVLYPLWQSRQALYKISRGILLDIFTLGKGVRRSDNEQSPI